MEKGQTVYYTGRGFMGYDPDKNSMIYIEEDSRSLFGVFVEYKGNRVLVNSHEITRVKP